MLARYSELGVEKHLSLECKTIIFFARTEFENAVIEDYSFKYQHKTQLRERPRERDFEIEFHPSLPIDINLLNKNSFIQDLHLKTL